MKHRTTPFMAGLTAGQLKPLRTAVSYAGGRIVKYFRGIRSRLTLPVGRGWDNFDPINSIPHTVRLVPEINRDTAQIIRIKADGARKAPCNVVD